MNPLDDPNSFLNNNSYDRNGRHITWMQQALMRTGDVVPFSPNYYLIGLDYVGAYAVSTVWLGFDHGFGSGAPMIFETMVFLNSDLPGNHGWDQGCWRYSTEDEAIEGHKATIILIEATVGLDVVDEAEMNSEPSRNGDDEGGACV